MDKKETDSFSNSVFLNSILNSSDFSIIATDCSGIIKHFSKGAEKLLGYKAEEVVGIVTPELFHCKDEIKKRAIELSSEFNTKINPDFSVFVSKAERGLEDDNVWTYITKEKKKLSVKLSISKLTSETGKFIGFIGIGKDISRELNIKEELLQLRKFHEAVVDNADIWITTTDINSNVIIWNQSAERISGYTKEETLGNSKIWELIYPSKTYRGKLYKEAINLLKENEFVQGFETKIKRKDGQYKIMSWNFRFLYDKNNSEHGTLVIGQDITDIKKAALKEKENQKIIEEKNRELENLLYVTSHDLRSPLVNVQGFTKEIETSLEEVKEIIFEENISEKTKEQLNTIIEADIKESNEFINSSVKKMNVLLEGLLHLSRLGRSPVVPDKINMKNLVDEILKTNEYIIKEEKIEIIREDLPDITGDPGKINQIFSNLIENAIKYSDKNKESYIKIAGKTNDSYHIFSVSDNGIGIEDNHIEKIFEIFYQLNPSSSCGDGLGLSIVTKLVEKHKGNITVESEKGKGTSFRISFPIV